MNPLLEKLGYGADARLVIFHADDVGMCHGSNKAFLELEAAGIVKTGSIMAPCPWAGEIVRHCQQHPSLDVGVHLTLTSEWDVYRWGPLTTRDPASGLVDEEGYFWHRVPMLQAHMNVDAAVREMRAQIEWVRRFGIEFTHLDTHMGAAMTPELIASYLQLGLEYQTPVLLPRDMDEYTQSLKLSLPDVELMARIIQDAESQGMGLVDRFRITPGHHPDGLEADRAELYEQILHDLPPGITYFSLHPNAPGEVEAFVPDRAYWRTFEYHYLQSDRLRDFLRREGIVPIGFRRICELMRNR